LKDTLFNNKINRSQITPITSKIVLWLKFDQAGIIATRKGLTNMEEKTVNRIRDTGARVKENVERVIVGKSEVVELAIVALLCEGHVLIEDVPGIGKTMLAKSLARSLGCSFRRIQCTPDLLPSDVTGTYIFNQKTSDFEFRAGPIMAQVVLADEINRATPRTQSALLEAMQEYQVTAEGETKPLPRPFMVLATQNPIELEGTFPLPEAQLDRFLLNIKIGYPAQEDDRVILARFRQTDPLEELTSVVTADELLEMQTACREIHVAADVEDYIIRLIHATRQTETVELGASPRAMLALYRASQALAALRSRAFVIPDDVKYLVPFVLVHRIIPRAESHLRGQTASETLREIVESVPVPVEEETATEEM
jgi:MoxR-like ATPase